MLATMDESTRPTSAPARIKDRPTWLISRAYARSSGLLNSGFEAKADGLRSYHYRLLASLAEQGPASQADLGRGTGIDRSDVTAAVNDLADRGLIERAIDPADRRRNIVSITRKGTKRLGDLDEVIADVQEQVLAPLSPTERRQFFTVMRRLAVAD
jgi:MarR family transcriptional regulator, lower aerobic nicotinate degradation pathway regulator